MTGDVLSAASCGWTSRRASHRPSAARRAGAQRYRHEFAARLLIQESGRPGSNRDVELGKLIDEGPEDYDPWG
jgi:hypothetical protein